MRAILYNLGNNRIVTEHVELAEVADAAPVAVAGSCVPAASARAATPFSSTNIPQSLQTER